MTTSSSAYGQNAPPENRDRSFDVNALPWPDDPANADKADDMCELPHGLVAGTVLRAARLSAHLSSRQLAAASGASDTDILSWESGTEPLASVPVTRIDGLKGALRTGGAEAHLIADLDAASWCDLVIEGIARQEDVSCLLADPLANEAPFAELFAWAVTGQVPARYFPYADAVRLVRPAGSANPAETAQA